MGYWRIEIDQRDRNKTEITSHHGLYRFSKTRFGLENAPDSFQRAMDVIPSSVRWQSGLVYLDNIVVFAKSSQNHIEQVRRVSRLLYGAGVTLKLKKCKFFAYTINYYATLLVLDAWNLRNTLQMLSRHLSTPAHKYNCAPWWDCLIFLGGLYRALRVSTLP